MGKLVRDKIPDIIKRDGKQVKTHCANDRNELIKVIFDKLHEEVDELQEAWDKTGEIDVEELIDIEEVLDKLKIESRLNFTEIKAKRDYKAIEKGVFDFDLILDEVE